jgi:hypothetical protein
MDLITKLKNNDELKNKFAHYFDDDQLRFLFIVILMIGVILLLSGVKYAILFLVVAFGLLAFLVIFIKPKQEDIIETFICQGFQNYPIFNGFNEEIYVTMLDDDKLNDSKLNDGKINEGKMNDGKQENCQIKFRNSDRNKK